MHWTVVVTQSKYSSCWWPPTVHAADWYRRQLHALHPVALPTTIRIICCTLAESVFIHFPILLSHAVVVSWRHDDGAPVDAAGVCHAGLQFPNR